MSNNKEELINKLDTSKAKCHWCGRYVDISKMFKNKSIMGCTKRKDDNNFKECQRLTGINDQQRRTNQQIRSK